MIWFAGTEQFEGMDDKRVRIRGTGATFGVVIPIEGGEIVKESRTRRENTAVALFGDQRLCEERMIGRNGADRKSTAVEE
jgi:hypothetical protein